MKGVMTEMAEVILDEVLAALNDAQTFIEGYDESLTEYQMLFESDDPEVADKINNNNNVAGKTDNALLRAVKAVRGIISNIISSISNFLKQVTMGKDEYASFKSFKEACKKDPSLRNKKVTVKDFRAVQKEYDSLLNELNAAIEESKRNENTSCDALIKKITGFLGKEAKSTGTIVAADALLNMAKGNINWARTISNTLSSQNSAMEVLEKELGAKGAADYKKKVNKLGKRISLERLKVKLLNQEYKSAADAVKATANTLSSYASGNVGKVAGAVAKDTFMAKSLLNNENTGKVIKGGLKAGVKAQIKANSKVNDEKKKEKRRERDIKNGTNVNQSALGFLTGSKRK